MKLPRLRVARPTDRLDELVEMYVRGLDVEVLGAFTDHEGFDGTILGVPGGAYHLEFTHERGKRAGAAATPENLLVFYLPEHAAWEAGCARMLAAGFSPVSSNNPYWDRRGRTFEDPDGYRVVLHCSDWGTVTP